MKKKTVKAFAIVNEVDGFYYQSCILEAMALKENERYAVPTKIVPCTITYEL